MTRLHYTLLMIAAFALLFPGSADAQLFDFFSGPRRARERMESSNNLKQFALAMHSFHSVHSRFPSPVGVAEDDKEAKPLLSWRVHILPYLEQQNLYDSFKLDEPWDSEHNKRLIEKMPKIFAAPGAKSAEEYKTVYLLPRGEGTGFSDNKPVSIAQIRDGTSNTIMIVEASNDDAVIWTKPDDKVIDAMEPIAGLVGLRQDGFICAFFDGSVHFMKKDIDKKTLQALFTRSGGEAVAF